MSFLDFSLSVKNFQDIPFNKYPNDFTFIVDNKRYRTSRLVADILSPTIRKNHYNDESNSEFIIHTTNTNNEQTTDQNVDYFSDFLKLSTMQEISLDCKRQSLYSEYFIQLGNIDEFCKLQMTNSNEKNELDSVRILQKITAIENKNKETIDLTSEQILYHIQNVSKIFYNIEKQELNKINVDILELIIKDENLKIQDEDQLIEFILDKYEEDHSFGFLFEYVIFKNVSEEMISKFIDSFNIEDINTKIWMSICTKISSSFSLQAKDLKNRYRKDGKSTKSTNGQIIEFKYEQGKEFKGIMNHMTEETGGNIHDNGTIEITSNSISGSNHPKNLVEYNNDNCYDPTGIENAFVCFDFKDKLVQLTDYSIRSDSSRNLKNWNLEVSKDGQNWETIDQHSNDPILKEKYKVATFNISPERNEFYRFIRLLETGPCWYNNTRYDGEFTMIEFFGKLQRPLPK